MLYKFKTNFKSNIAPNMAAQFLNSECTAKHKNKASYNTDYIAPDLTDFFGDDRKVIKMQIEKTNIFVKNFVRTKNWFAVSNF